MLWKRKFYQEIYKNKSIQARGMDETETSIVVKRLLETKKIRWKIIH